MAGKLSRNLLIGLAAGAAGTLAMDGFWQAYYKLRPQSKPSSEEPSTVKLVRRGLRQVGVRSPSKRTRQVGSQAVHWGYGTTWGTLTGLSHAAGVPLDGGGGQLLGAGLWAGGDVWMLYKMGLAKHPQDYPVETHLSALGAHLVYGLGVWATGKALAHLMPESRSLRRAA